MPGETDGFLGRCLDVLDDVALQGFVVEAKIGSLGIKLFLLEVIAVMTVEVTDCPYGLYHDLKFARCSFQRPYLQ
jgi:hypothetical protein